MKLSQYIAERRITQAEAAKGIGISRPYLSDILNEKVIPGRAVAFKIVNWTQGMVRLEDLWQHETPKTLD